ncbi:MAG: MBL fold metallo-hydrolase, partial [Alphaproteobacteria bacterium]|nr:MBL fold metallo-hydrolase [Alphaproteobacteria bacterium]
RLVGRPDKGVGSVRIQVNAFIAKFGDKLILIDAGCGNTMGPTLGHLAANLRAGGVDPSKVTHVLLTHIHPDHSNGLVDANNQPAFPNAEVLVHENDAKFWLERAPESGDDDFVTRNIAAARRVLAPYLTRLRRVTNGEALPGVSAYLSAGHTPGHTTWLIHAGKDAVLFWGDTVHVGPIQFAHPKTTLIYDLDQQAAAASRARVFDWVSADRIRVAGAHLELPGFGYVTRKGAGFAFESEA